MVSFKNLIWSDDKAPAWNNKDSDFPLITSYREKVKKGELVGAICQDDNGEYIVLKGDEILFLDKEGKELVCIDEKPYPENWDELTEEEQDAFYGSYKINEFACEDDIPYEVEDYLENHLIEYCEVPVIEQVSRLIKEVK
jgi:hypothetical protein